jgi:hypothetical protein
MTHFPIYNQICALAIMVEDKQVIDECYENLDKIEDAKKITDQVFRKEMMHNFNEIALIIENMGVYYGNKGNFKKVGELAKYAIKNYPEDVSGWYLLTKYIGNTNTIKEFEDEACFGWLAANKAYKLGTPQQDVIKVAKLKMDANKCKPLEEYVNLFLNGKI